MRRDLEAVLEFLPADQGGRASPVRSGYRAQINYDGRDFDASYQYPDDDEVPPGGRARAFLTFPSPSLHSASLVPGKAFTVREGARVVAHGHVERLVDLLEAELRERLHNALEAYYLTLGANADEADAVKDLSRQRLVETRHLRDLLKTESSLSEFRDEVIRVRRVFHECRLPGENTESWKAFVELASVPLVAG